jgi:hypothetical protein
MRVNSLEAFLSEVSVPVREREHGYGVVGEKTHNHLGLLLNV